MAQAQLGPAYDLAKRVSDLEAQVKALLTQPVARNMSANQSDGSVGFAVTLPDGGVTTSYWPYGPGTPGATKTNGQWPLFLYIGQLISGGVPAGTGMTAQRPDGSLSLVVGNAGVTISDAHNNVVFSNDSTSGVGLSSPLIPYPAFQNTNIATWPATSNGTWTTIADSEAYLQHPKLYLNAQGYAPTGVTGQFRLVINGTQAGSTWTASNNAFTSSLQTITLPSPTWQQTLSMQLQAQVTAGAGTISATVYGAYGAGS